MEPFNGYPSNSTRKQSRFFPSGQDEAHEDQRNAQVQQNVNVQQRQQGHPTQSMYNSFGSMDGAGSYGGNRTQPPNHEQNKSAFPPGLSNATGYNHQRHDLGPQQQAQSYTQFADHGMNHQQQQQFAPRQLLPQQQQFLQQFQRSNNDGSSSSVGQTGNMQRIDINQLFASQEASQHRANPIQENEFAYAQQSELNRQRHFHMDQMSSANNFMPPQHQSNAAPGKRIEVQQLFSPSGGNPSGGMKQMNVADHTNSFQANVPQQNEFSFHPPKLNMQLPGGQKGYSSPNVSRIIGHSQQPNEPRQSSYVQQSGNVYQQTQGFPKTPVKMHQQQKIVQSPLTPSTTAALPPSTPPLGPKQLDANELRAAQARAARVARFEWQPVGEMTVNPSSSYPESDIEVRWQIPLDMVSKSSYDQACRPKRGHHHNRNRGGPNGRDEPENEQAYDWIGLFRARLRVDNVENHILTRKVQGQARVDHRRGVAYGKIRLRTPRGVGEYDFRYFRASPDKVAHADNDTPPMPTLPVTRSNTVRVEVQGCVLFEALSFVNKYLKEKSARKLSSAAAQFATLIMNVRSLEHPFEARSNGKSPQDQQMELMEIIWKITETIMRKYRSMDEQLIETIQSCEAKLEPMREKLSAYIEQKKRIELEQEAQIKATGNKIRSVSTILEEEDDVPIDLQEKRDLEKTLFQSKRDQTSMGSAVHDVLLELIASPVIFPLLTDKEKKQILDMKRLYCPLIERFLDTYEDLAELLKSEYNLNPASENEQLQILTLDRQCMMTPFPILGLSPKFQGRFHSEYYFSLSEQLTKTAATLIPGKEFVQHRSELIQRVQKLINTNTSWGNHARLFAFGSSANLFGSHGADLDLSLIFPNVVDPLPSACRIIEDTAQLLEKDKEQYDGIDDERKTARIPILQFNDVKLNLECDICINNRLALRNTEMLKTYAQIDPRVRLVAAIIKKWSKMRNINNPSEHTLSSYGYLLMMIHYFQRCGPNPLVPVLQLLPPNWDGISAPLSLEEATRLPKVMEKSMDGREHDTYFYGDSWSSYFNSESSKLECHQKLREFASRNKSSVVELLAGFFFEYGFEFDSRRFVIAVRSGTKVSKEHKAVEDSWKLHPRIAIEDPFETGYDVGHVLRDYSFKTIRSEFARAYGILANLHREFDSSMAPQVIVDGLLESKLEKQALEEVASDVSKMQIKQ